MYVPFGLKLSWMSPMAALIYLLVIIVGILLTFFPDKCFRKRSYAGKKRYTVARVVGIIILSVCLGSFLYTNVFHL